MHFQHSGRKIQVFEQNIDIINSLLFGVLSKEKKAVSSHEIAGEFHRPHALIENPVYYLRFSSICTRVHILLSFTNSVTFHDLAVTLESFQNYSVSGNSIKIGS